jgi:hypothetical protein
MGRLPSNLVPRDAAYSEDGHHSAHRDRDGRITLASGHSGAHGTVVDGGFRASPNAGGKPTAFDLERWSQLIARLNSQPPP